MKRAKTLANELSKLEYIESAIQAFGSPNTGSEAQKEMVIDCGIVSWWPLFKQWEAKKNNDFCNLMAYQGSDGAGRASVYFFNRAELKRFEAYTLFGGLKNEKADSYTSRNIIYRYVAAS